MARPEKIAAVSLSAKLLITEENVPCHGTLVNTGSGPVPAPRTDRSIRYAATIQVWSGGASWLQKPFEAVTSEDTTEPYARTPRFVLWTRRPPSEGLFGFSQSFAQNPRVLLRAQHARCGCESGNL